MIARELMLLLMFVNGPPMVLYGLQLLIDGRQVFGAAFLMFGLLSTVTSLMNYKVLHALAKRLMGV